MKERIIKATVLLSILTAMCVLGSRKWYNELEYRPSRGLILSSLGSLQLSHNDNGWCLPNFTPQEAEEEFNAEIESLIEAQRLKKQGRD